MIFVTGMEEVEGVANMFELRKGTHESNNEKQGEQRERQAGEKTDRPSQRNRKKETFYRRSYDRRDITLTVSLLSRTFS
jgi:hypothetical protein